MTNIGESVTAAVRSLVAGFSIDDERTNRYESGQGLVQATRARDTRHEVFVSEPRTQLVAVLGPLTTGEQRSGLEHALNRGGTYGSLTRT